MITLMDAVQALRPGAECNIRGDVYSGIEWLDKAQGIPTEEEVNAKLSELQAEEPFKLLREERNRRLAECDWIVTKNAEYGYNISKEWRNYRQALRDLPDKSNPKLNSIGRLDMSSITWPTKPSS